MLGRDVTTALAGRDAAALTTDALDVTDLDACRAAVVGADVVVNCAAWTAVDAAESQEPAAFAVNALGAANLARASAEQGAWLVHVSTDYVFSGSAATPYAEQAPLSPRSAYGRTKAAGEWAVQALLPGRHHLVRTAWLYGNEGPSFVHTMLGLAVRPEQAVTVVDDQHGQPTWSLDVATRLVALVDSAAPSGTYHATSSGVATWFDVAVAVLSAVGADPGRVQRASTAQVPRPAARPAWSVLGHDGWSRCAVDPIEAWLPRLQTFLAGRA
jgi:dTDP-4-dehydrorhamnose reductase